MSPLNIDQHGGVLVLTMNRPQQRNALDMEMREALANAVHLARDTDAIQCVVLTGSGSAFCAGGDLKSLMESDRPPHADRERIRRLHLWFRDLVNLEKPVVAAIDGPAYGAGFNLALACDFILATPSARLCSVFGRLGVVPDLGGLFLLPRMVGLQRAKEIVFSTRELTAQEAHSLGIVHEIIEQGQLVPRAMELGKNLTNLSPEAFGMTKNILNRSFNLDQDTLAELEAYAQAVARQTTYHKNAVKSFLNKTALRFNGLK